MHTLYSTYFRSLVQVVAPLLSNSRNHSEWPQVVSQDVRRHVHSLQTNVFVVSGRVQGHTLLPPPAGSDSVETEERQRSTRDTNGHGDASLHPTSKVERGEVTDKSIIHSVESAVIGWSHQIRAVLEKDSSEALLEGRNPTPHTELLFWKNRSVLLFGFSTQTECFGLREMMHWRYSLNAL